MHLDDVTRERKLSRVNEDDASVSQLSSFHYPVLHHTQQHSLHSTGPTSPQSHTTLFTSSLLSFSVVLVSSATHAHTHFIIQVIFPFHTPTISSLVQCAAILRKMSADESNHHHVVNPSNLPLSHSEPSLNEVHTHLSTHTHYLVCSSSPHIPVKCMIYTSLACLSLHVHFCALIFTLDLTCLSLSLVVVVHHLPILVPFHFSITILLPSCLQLYRFVSLPCYSSVSVMLPGGSRRADDRR